MFCYKDLIPWNRSLMLPWSSLSTLFWSLWFFCLVIELLYSDNHAELFSYFVELSLKWKLERRKQVSPFLSYNWTQLDPGKFCVLHLSILQSEVSCFSFSSMFTTMKTAKDALDNSQTSINLPFCFFFHFPFFPSYINFLKNLRRLTKLEVVC